MAVTAVTVDRPPEVLARLEVVVLAVIAGTEESVLLGLELMAVLHQAVAVVEEFP